MVEEFTLSDSEISQADPFSSSPKPDPAQPADSRPGVHYTPMVSKQATDECFTSSPDERDPRLILMGNEMVNKILGPMPVEEFLEEFLPAPNVKLGSLDIYHAEMRKVSQSKDESEMYSPFVKAVQTLCPNFSVVESQDKPLTVFHKVIIRPDIGVYPKNDTGDISKMEVTIEAKHHRRFDPFLDTPGKPLINVTKATTETLGQITSYAAAHQAAQFRSFVFSLLVFPTYARILRWDRSGVIVTNKVLLSSTYLAEFFHRFDSMTAEERGIDPTVINPSRADERRARQTLRVDDNTRLLQLSVAGSNYIVPRDTYMGGTRSPLGRSTRAFFAYSLSLKKMVFLKDTWRLQSQTPEHDVYATLKEKEVPYIATVIAGEDVLGRKTRTQDFAKKKSSWAKDRPRKLRKHRHYRLVLEEVGSSLTKFPSTKTLVKVMHEALIAHKKAYEEAKILHRDISPNNIMIYKGSALLIDWDLSKSLEDNQRARESERTGTWQFTAARLLDPQTAGPHTLTDDIESFVHVLTWTAIRYAGHGITKEKLTDFLQSVYDHSFTDEKGNKDNGSSKCQHLLAPVKLKQAEFKSPNLKSLLLYITDVVATRYREPPAVIEDEWEGALAESQFNDEPTEVDRAKMQRNYDRKLEALKSSKWIIDSFAKALDRPNWPENDAAEEHELATLPSRLKSTTQQTGLEDEEEVKSVGSGQEDKDTSSSDGERPTKKARLDTGGNS